MEWINEKAKTLKQGAIRAMFDRANTMTGVISLGIGEPDMPVSYTHLTLPTIWHV